MKKKIRQSLKRIKNYIWIFLICIVLAYIAFHFFLSVLNEQISSTLSVASQQMKNFYDSEFEKQQLCIYNAINLRDVKNLPEELENANRYQRSKAIESAVDGLRKSFSNIDSLTDCAVIYENSDAAITFSGYMKKSDIYSIHFKQSYGDYEKWHQEMFSFEGINKYIRIRYDGVEHFIALYKWEHGKDRILAIMFVSPNILIERAMNENERQQITAVMSEEGELLLSSRSIDIESEALNNDSIKTNGKEYHAASTASNDGQLRYILLVPENQYRIKVRLVTGIAVICALLCLILCAVTAYILSKKEYIPIQRIINKIGGKQKNGESDFLFIEKEVEKIIEKNLSITLNLNKKGIKLRETSLANLIKYKSDMSPEELYEEFGIDLRTSGCVLILTEVLQSGVFQCNETKKIQLVISNVFSELMENTAKCYWLNVEKKYVCIVNSDDVNVVDIVYENLEFLTDFVLENFGIELRCAISRKNDIYALPELYLQAQELLKIESTDWKIMLYDELTEYLSAESEGEELTMKKGGRGEERISLIYRYINEHFHEPLLNISAVAANFDITVNHLSRSFRQSYGIKPSEYLLRCRVEKAAELLKNTDMNVAETGKACGFLNTGMFIRAFKKIYGTTPGIYANEDADSRIKEGE